MTLPSGNTVDFRDRMMRGDMVEARRALRTVVAPDGSRTTSASVIDDVRLAIYRTMIVSWSFGADVPRNCASKDLAERMLNGYLDEDDSVAMDMTVQPWVDKVLADVGARAVIHNATGLRVTAASDADLAALLASGEFTPAGPKAISGPSPTATGSSPAELESGPEGTETTAPTP